MATALYSAAPASAQLVISGSGVSGSANDSVVVDRGVLDRLGQPRSLPSLLNPDAQAPGAPITLRPPKAESPAPAPAPKVVEPPRKTAPAKPAPKQAIAKAEKKPAKPVHEAKPTPVKPAPVRVAEAKPEPAKPAPVRVAEPKPEPPKPAPVRVAEAKPEPPKPEPATRLQPGKPPAMLDAPRPFIDPPKPTAMTAPTAAAPTPVAPAPQPQVRAAALPEPPPPPPPAEPRGLVPPPPVPEVAVVQPPAPPPAPVEPPKPLVTQPAKVTPASVAVAAPKGGYVERAGKASVTFTPDQAELPEEARAPLEALARRMEKDPSLYLQLLAYAEGSEAEASKARRLSLSRALAVRSYLMNYGLRSTRIDVRALGNKVPEGPADRVDLVVEKR